MEPCSLFWGFLNSERADVPLQRLWKQLHLVGHLSKHSSILELQLVGALINSIEWILSLRHSKANVGMSILPQANMPVYSTIKKATLNMPCWHTLVCNICWAYTQIVVLPVKTMKDKFQSIPLFGSSYMYNYICFYVAITHALYLVLFTIGWP